MFEVTTQTANPLDGNAGGVAVDQQRTAPVFVTEQSLLSFAAMSAVVQLLWKALQQSAGGWADSAWTAFGIAGLIGLAQFLPILKKPLPQWPDLLRAGIFAAINTAVLWAAAIGIDEQV